MTVSSSTLCLFLTTGHISHILTYMPRTALSGVTFSHFFSPAPRSALHRGAFFSSYLLLCPAPLFGAWLFQLFSSPVPRTTLWGVAFSALIFSCAPHHSRGRGFFSAYLLLRPAPLFTAWFFRHFPLLCPAPLESCRPVSYTHLTLPTKA